MVGSSRTVLLNWCQRWCICHFSKLLFSGKIRYRSNSMSNADNEKWLSNNNHSTFWNSFSWTFRGSNIRRCYLTNEVYIPITNISATRYRVLFCHNGQYSGLFNLVITYGRCRSGWNKNYFWPTLCWCNV